MRGSIALLAAVACFAAVGCSASDPTRSETYTNVRADTTSGHTATGEVVSFENDAVTLRTATGNEVFQVTDDTRGREHLVVGQNLAIDFNRASGTGAPVATEIRIATDEDTPDR